jgi:hypothetical protein
MRNVPPARALWPLALCGGVGAWLGGPPGRLLVVLPLLLFGPGYLIERVCCRTTAPSASRELNGFVRPTIWLGLSLSSIALLYAWTTALSLTLTTTALRLASVALLVAVIWRSLAAPARTTRLVRLVSEDRWLIGLTAVFGLTLWTRFHQIRSLALPPWVDSVHHAFLIRLVTEHGQAPYSLRPYLPIDHLPYHWGYHVFMAAVTQVSGLSLVHAMLWSGQVLNALHVLTVAGLAAYLWRRPVAAVTAGLVVGLVSIMPAYYVSWGRYTQLTGLLILPPLVIAWSSLLHTPTKGWVCAAAILLAGLFLIHVRVFVFGVAYVAVSTALWAVRKPWPNIRARFAYGAAAAGFALVLVSPWLWNLAVKLLKPVVERPRNLVGEDFYTRLKPELLWAGHNRVLIALAVAFGVWALLQTQLPAAEQMGWVLCLFVLANPWLLAYVLPALVALALLVAVRARAWKFASALAVALAASLAAVPELLEAPSSWLITNDVVTISLFIPIGVLIGGGVAMVFTWSERTFGPRGLKAASWGAAAGLGAAVIWAMVPPRDVVNPSLVFATRADLDAIAWSRQHTPPGARFLINATPWFPGTPRGTDGGWWLLPLAGRWTTTPPAIVGNDTRSRYASRALADAELVANFRPGQEQTLYDLIERDRVGYVYLGAQPGPLSPATFARNPRFQTVYAREGVTIIAVVTRRSATLPTARGHDL